VVSSAIDGVELDFEGLYRNASLPHNRTLGQAFVQLVVALRASLRSHNPHAIVTVATSAIDIQKQPFYLAGYPLKQLSEAADAIAMMCYDMNNHWPITAGPNSPLVSGTWGIGVKEAVQQAISAGAQREKLIMLAPWYGRLYSCSGNSTNPKVVANCSIDMATAVHPPSFDYFHAIALLRSNACTSHWHEPSSTPYFECVNETSGVRTQGWYDTAQSLSLKYKLAKSIGLWGVGVYQADSIGRLQGQSATAMWQNLEEFLQPVVSDDAEIHRRQQPAL
jgi:spore germination protein YaaH